MSVYDIATETVKQGGTRRGANMAVLQVDHPDIEAFIQSKTDPDMLNNFNISVAVTDNFMDALEKGSEYELINPRTGDSVASVPAKQIFDMIIDSAWLSGEPGIIFIDCINAANQTPVLGKIEATNPCGEQPLLPHESCTLGSINLSAMVKGNNLNFERLKQTVRTAVHFLDNVIEINQYPLAVIESMSKRTRKIGLGVMGFADMLIKLEIPYNSDKAVEQAEMVMSFILQESRKASADLAKKRGNFPAYKGSCFNHPSTPYMRNATTTTIAPTGTISIIAGVSSGIEPLFALVYTRSVFDKKKLAELHPVFAEKAKKEGFFNPNLAKVLAATGSIRQVDQMSDNLKKIFITAHDISPEWHIKIQAAFQKYTDNAVSKTINLPFDAMPEDIERAYLSAYHQGCKGITIYRYGSRDRQVLNIEPAGNGAEKVAPRPRPVRTHGVTERIRTGCGKLYVTTNYDAKGMCEVFAQMGKTGGCASSQIEAAGRLISLALRSGVKVEAIIKQITGIRCPSPAWQDGNMVLSCPDAIARVLKNLLGSNFVEKSYMMGICPECNGLLAHMEGCLICHACGFSKCS
jgi:ribonucleoside-diphosphate reductase alpha chain